MNGREMRKIIELDDETYQALVQLGRDRMATLQELADEAFADLLKKHGVPIDLKDALRRSARKSKSEPTKPNQSQTRKVAKRSAKRT
jgi:non-homologous end joining protein Ku